MKKCYYCPQDVKYEQDHMSDGGRPAHVICDNERKKREFEGRCICCNTDAKDGECINKKCDGTTFIGYKGPQ